MSEKGNRIDNWNADYSPLATSYTENPTTAGELSNLIRHEIVLEDIRKYLPNVENPSIVEVGCGGARTSIYLARRGFEVTCTDFSPEAIRLARANFEAAGTTGRLVQDDLLRSTLSAGAFDCVMSFGLLEHFDRISDPIASMTRLIRPGGLQLHVIIPKRLSTQSVMDAVWFPGRLLRNAIRGQFERIVERSFRQFPHFESSFKPSDYIASFSEAGNEVLRCEAAGMIYPFFALPGPLGRTLVRIGHPAIRAAARFVDRTERKPLVNAAPGFYLVLRRRLNT